MVLPPGETLADAVPEASGMAIRRAHGGHSVRSLRAAVRGSPGPEGEGKGAAGGFQRLEGRLEAAQILEVALREELRQEKERSEALRAELEKERRVRGHDEPRGAWRRFLGG